MLGKRQLKKLPPGSLLIHQDENGRFSATNELVLQNLLISTELDFQLIADLTNISLGKVVEIYLKYQQYIDKVIVTEEEADKDNTAIENCLTLLSEHIAQVIEWQSKSETKLLKATDLTNILRILDRLIAIKNTKISQFDKITTSLINITAKVKQLEYLENGKLEIATDSDYNFSSIADKLDELCAKANVPEANRKPIYTVTTDGKITKYNSIAEATRLLSMGQSSLYNHLDTNLVYHGKKFFTETYSKCKNSRRVAETMEVATHINEWIRDAEQIRIEPGRHHAFDFVVFKTVYNNQEIEFKAKSTEGLIVYMMRLP